MGSKWIKSASDTIFFLIQRQELRSEMKIIKACYTLLLALLCTTNLAVARDAAQTSFHLGLVHPNGVDVVGYSVEKKLSDRIYSFYNFGIPSFAATGLTFYQQYSGTDFTVTAGVGIGFVMYGSAANQWKIEQQQYLKLGAGLAAGVAHSGVIPVLSYEYRFEQ